MRYVTIRAIQKYLFNPFTKLFHGFVPGTILLETTGRRTGKPRRVPVGGRMVDDAFWIVAEHGRKADYVRNVEADPKVRLRTKGRWHTGTARVVEDDDPRERLRKLPKFNSSGVRMFGTDLLSIRIDLHD